MNFGRLLCALSGMAVLCLDLVPQIIARIKCTERVVGKCIGHRYKHRTGKYTPEYEILWHGQPIVVHSRWYKQHPGKPKPKVGTEVMLRVNPNNPLEFCTNSIHVEWGILFGACMFWSFIILDIVYNGL